MRGGRRQFSIFNFEFAPCVRGYNPHMKLDTRLAVVIFAVLTALVVLPLALHQIRGLLRPRIVEARVVTASGHDPVFRDGPRHVPAGDHVEVAVALRVEQLGRQPRWLAPTSRLELDGVPVEAVATDAWPERDRSLRVFWFTVECINVGGDITSENAGGRLRYRTFLAPEMGRSLLAAAYPEPHNDDHLGLPRERAPSDAGTMRFYARVEVVDPEHDLRPLQAAATLGVNGIPDPAFPAVHRGTRLPDGVHGAVGELFLLPGFEPLTEPPEDPNEVTRAALGLGIDELAERRLMVSSSTFAAVAATGSPTLEGAAPAAQGPLRWKDGRVTRRERPLRWELDAAAGDLLRDGTHWTVLLADDGNGLVDGDDQVIHCWRSPPARTTLAAVLTEEGLSLELFQTRR